MLNTVTVLEGGRTWMSFLISVLTEDPPAPFSPPSAVAPWAEVVVMWVLFRLHMAYSCLYNITCQARQTETQRPLTEATFSIVILLISCLFPHVSVHHSTVQFCRTCKSIEANSSLDKVQIPQDCRASYQQIQGQDSGLLSSYPSYLTTLLCKGSPQGK